MEDYKTEAVSRSFIPNRIIAIIPARGGSKGLPRKNIHLLGGKPLINHTIEASLSCPYISRSIVTTDCPEIKEVSLQCGAEVLERPKSLATDSARSQDVVKHVLDVLNERGELPDYFVLLQPTSPLRRGCHITECIREFIQSKALSALSVTDVDHHPYKMFFEGENQLLKPLYSEKYLHEPRQLLPKIYRQNGAIYIMSSSLFLVHKTFFLEPAMPYIMNAECSIDIDSELDMKVAELLLAKSIREC